MLCETILSHHQRAPTAATLYAPRTLSTALLRLTDWETSSPAGGIVDESLQDLPDAYKAQVLEVGHLPDLSPLAEHLHATSANCARKGCPPFVDST